MKVIIECDDFGLNYGFSDAIHNSLIQGISKSTCIRVNGQAYKYSLSLIKTNPKIFDVGLHVDLTHGPFLTNIPLFFKSNYSITYIEYCLRLLLNDKRLIRAIENEISAQFNKLHLDKVKISHVNGHDHIHMIPKIFEIICKTAKKNGVNRIRITNEPFHLSFNFINLIKYLILKAFTKKNIKTAQKLKMKYPNSFYGLIDSNNMNLANIVKSLENAIISKFEIIEIAIHPAYPHYFKDQGLKMSRLTKWFTNLTSRTVEFGSLHDKKLIQFIENNNIKLISYKNL